MNDPAPIGLIGGTGLNQLPHLTATTAQWIQTPYGLPSAPLMRGVLHNRPVVFLARHGIPHQIAPHRVNYRANLWALHHVGVRRVLAVAAVGGITPPMGPATLVVPDQLIDYTSGRIGTFYDGDFATYPVDHIDFTRPYSESLRALLLTTAQALELSVVAQGTLGVTQGPRLETAAEIRRLEKDGCDLVGMTALPEAALARELGMEYATLAVVANWAAGKVAGEITMADIEQNLHVGMAQALVLLSGAIAADQP